jgi:FtsP/CotA-like multicopper oxidase with cupredoxin domain
MGRVSDRVLDNRKLTGIKAFGAALIMLAMLVPLVGSMSAIPPAQVPPGTIDPTTIPKWANTLTGPPPVYVPSDYVNGDGVTEHNYSIDVTEFYQQILPAPMPTTKVWGYGGDARDSLTGAPLGYVRNSPAPSFEEMKGTPVNVRWTNNLTSSHQFAVDPTLHWANPNDISVSPDPETELYDTPYPEGYEGAQTNVPIVTHLHGGEVSSLFDGQPEAWYTNSGTHGKNYNTYTDTWNGVPIGLNEAVFHYPNEQPATTLWYHDHALGITRLNVMSGLAGFYFLREAGDPAGAVLPSGAYEMPLVFQDRTFNLDGSFWFPSMSDDQTYHPYWMPEFFGNTIMVNGKIWPSMNVDQGWYRLRLLDGSNARFYTMSFRVLGTSTLLPFYQIGSDGGYLKAPALLTQLTIAPGERCDILIDFSSVPAGGKVLLSNIAKAPFPSGTAPNPKTEGQLIQFVSTGVAGFQKNVALIPQLPTPLNPTLATAFPALGPATKTRVLVLWEVQGPIGPIEVLLNGMKWMAPTTELPVYGTTEDWVIVNPTADAHPIHTHLTQFQLVSRQKMDTVRYARDWVTLQQTTGGLGEGATPPWPHMDDPYVPLELSPTAYLRGKAMPAPANEQGWKDTIQVYPGEVTILRIRFSPTDGSPSYSFDPTAGPGYVWHCHILDHEDNEMMRPYEVQARP